VAFLLCPLPRESEVTCCPFSTANLISRSVGSTPAVSTKIIGRFGADSSYMSDRLAGLLEINS